MTYVRSQPRPYAAVVRGFPAFALALVSQRELERLVQLARAQGFLEEELAELRLVVAEIQLAAKEYQQQRASVSSNSGRAEAEAPEVAAGSRHEELTPFEAGEIIGVTDRRIRQMLEPGGDLHGAGRRAGGGWLIQRHAVEMLRDARRTA